MEVTTWLPVYDSELFQIDYRGERSYLADNGITETELEEWDSSIVVREAEEDYFDKCKDLSVDFITEKLKALGYIHSSKGNPKNYRVRIDSNNLKKIKADIIKYGELWAIYLKERYSSYSGFMSWHDNTPEGDDWKSICKALKHEHRCGAILQFLLYADRHGGRCSSGSVNIQFKLIEAVLGSAFFGVCPEDYRKDLREEGFYNDKLELLKEICVGKWLDFWQGCDLSQWDNTPEIAEFIRVIDNREFYKLLNEMQPKLFTTENIIA